MENKEHTKLWNDMVEILENNFPKLNYKNVSKPSSNNRAQALVMLSDMKMLFKKKLIQAIEEVINELESNPNEDGSTSPNIQHWIEKKQSQLRKKYI